MLTGILSVVSSILFMLYGVPQIVKFYRTKDSGGFSLLTFGMLIGAVYSSYLIIVLEKKGLDLLIPWTINIVELGWMYVLMIKYRKGNVNSSIKEYAERRGEI